MTTPTIDNDLELTAEDLLAGHYYVGAETDRTDDQLQESFEQAVRARILHDGLGPDEQASFDVKRTIPKAVSA